MESASKVANCEICGAGFGLMTRSHKCKRCKRAVCSKCGKGKRIIIGYEDSKQHRTCDACEADIQFHSKLRTTHTLAWNYLSDIGKQWIDLIPNLKKMKEDTSYESLLKEAEQVGKSDDNFSELESDLDKGLADGVNFNYSLYEFFFYLQEGIPPYKCREHVKNVLRAHCMRNPSMGYTSGLTQVTAFLLCFLNEESAFWLLTHLVENVLPPHLYSKVEKDIMLYGYHAENFVIKSILKEKFALKKPEEGYAVDAFVDIALPLLLLPLLVDTLNISTLYVLWDQMLQAGSFFVFERALLAIILKHKELVLDQNMLAGRRYQDIFCKDITYEFIQTKTKLVDVKEEQILKLRADFELYFEKEWEKRSMKPRQTITGGKRFMKAEVEALHQGYRALLKTRGGKKTHVTRDEFKALMLKIAPSEKTAIEIGPMKVFEMFDLDRDGIIEQSDFVASSVLLMKGSFEDKIIECFKFNATTDKNYLTPDEYNHFVETVVRAGLVIMRNETDPSVLRKVASFKKNMVKAIKNNTKIKYVDVQEKIMKDDLVLDLSKELEGRRRMSTVVAGASRLRLTTKQMKQEEPTQEMEEPDSPIEDRRRSTAIRGAAQFAFLKKQQESPKQEMEEPDSPVEDRRRSTAIRGPAQLAFLKKQAETQDKDPEIEAGSRFEERKRSTVIMGGLQLNSGEDDRRRSTVIMGADQLKLNPGNEDKAKISEPGDERRRSSAIMGMAQLYQKKPEVPKADMEEEEPGEIIEDRRRRSKAVFSSSRTRSNAQIEEEIKDQGIQSKTSLDERDSDASKTTKPSESFSLTLEPEIDEASCLQITKLQEIGAKISGFLTEHTLPNASTWVSDDNKPKSESSCLTMEPEVDDEANKRKEVLYGMEERTSKQVEAQPTELGIQSDELLVQPSKSLTDAMVPEPEESTHKSQLKSDFLTSTSQSLESHVPSELSNTTEKPSICFDSSAALLLPELSEEIQQNSEALRAFEQHVSLPISCQDASETSEINSNDVKQLNVAEILTEDSPEKEFVKEDIIRKLQENYSLALEGHSNGAPDSLGEHKVLRENMAQELELIQDEQIVSNAEIAEKSKALLAQMLSRLDAHLEPQNPESTVSSCNIPITGQSLSPDAPVEDETVNSVQQNYQQLIALAQKISALPQLVEINEKLAEVIKFPSELFSQPSLQSDPEEGNDLPVVGSENEKLYQILKSLDQKLSESLESHSLPDKTEINAPDVKMSNVLEPLTQETLDHEFHKEHAIRKLPENCSTALEFHTESTLNTVSESHVQRENIASELLQDEPEALIEKSSEITDILSSLPNRKSVHLTPHELVETTITCQVMILRDSLSPENAEKEEIVDSHHHQKLIAIEKSVSLLPSLIESHQTDSQSVQFPNELFTQPSVPLNSAEEDSNVSHINNQTLKSLEEKTSPIPNYHLTSDITAANIHEITRSNFAEGIEAVISDNNGFLKEDATRSLPEKRSQSLEPHAADTTNNNGEHNVLRENMAESLETIPVDKVAQQIEIKGSTYLEPQEPSNLVLPSTFELPGETLNPLFPENEDLVNPHHHAFLAALEQKVSQLPIATEESQPHCECTEFPRGLFSHSSNPLTPEEDSAIAQFSQILRELDQRTSPSVEANSNSENSVVNLPEVQRINVAEVLTGEISETIQFAKEENIRRLPETHSCLDPQSPDNIVTPRAMELSRSSLVTETPCQDENAMNHHNVQQLVTLENKVFLALLLPNDNDTLAEATRFPNEIFTGPEASADPETDDKLSTFPLDIEKKTADHSEIHAVSEIVDNSTLTYHTEIVESTQAFHRAPSFMPQEPILVSANPNDEIGGMDEMRELEETKMPELTTEETDLPEPISTNFLAPMEEEPEDVISKNHHEKYLDIEKKSSTAPSSQGIEERVHHKDSVVVARADFCAPLECDEGDFSVTNGLIARYKAIEQAISSVLLAHVDSLVTKLHNLIERQANPAGVTTAGNQDRSSAESETSSMKVRLSIDSDNEPETDGHTDDGSKLSGFGKAAKQKSQHHEASDTKKNPNLSLTSDGNTTETLKSTEVSRTTPHDSFTSDESSRREKAQLLDSFAVIEEEDPDMRSEGAHSHKVSTIDLNSSQLIDEYHDLHKESFIRADSIIITDMKGAPKSRIEEIRSNNKDKSAEGLSCKGCSIF